MIKPIALIGFYGTGKSTIGRKAASQLDMPFADLAIEIETRCGLRIPDFYHLHGEAAYRDLESLALSAATANGVVATTGGCVMPIRNRRVLHESYFTVFLDIPFALAYRRMGTNSNPSIEALSKHELERLYDLRRPLYAAIAHHKLDGSLPVNELVDALIDLAHSVNK